MKNSLKNRIKEPLPQGVLPQQILRGKDLKEYTVLPDFELKERIIGDDKEGAGTNLLDRPVNTGSTAIIEGI